MNSLLASTPLAFFATSPQPCPYLPDRYERRLVTDLSRRDAVAVHDALSQAGFRRSHTLAYTPICHGCTACIPVRVDVRRFTPDRSHRRVLARNADLQVQDLPPAATKEQYALFAAYQRLRHNQGDMAKMGYHDYQLLIEQTPIQTSILEVRDTRRDLRAVCIVDRICDGLSAVYSFFDPSLGRRSLGTYIILSLINRSNQINLKYLYLGFWIAQTTKMAYKARFRPLEGYTASGWQPIEPQFENDCGSQNLSNDFSSRDDETA
jgi:Putative arginyl-tRNA:protein arginylyltransferase